MKIIVVILAVLIGGSLVALDVSRELWFFKVTEAQSKVMSGDRSAMNEFVELSKGPPVKRWWDKRADINDTFNTSYLSKARTVHLEMEMPFETLVRADGPVPEDVFKGVYAAAHAPSRLIAHCQELLNTIAVKCDVTHPFGKMNRDGLAEVSGLLRFVPVDDPGTLSQEENAKLVKLTVPLSRDVELPFSPVGREHALRRAQLACKALRAKIGNCVVTHVRLSAKRSRDASAPKMLDATARLTVFADPAQIDQTEVEALLERVVGSIEL